MADIDWPLMVYPIFVGVVGVAMILWAILADRE